VLPYRSSSEEVVNRKVSDSFLTEVDCIWRAPIGVGGGGLDGRQDAVKIFMRNVYG